MPKPKGKSAHLQASSICHSYKVLAARHGDACPWQMSSKNDGLWDANPAVSRRGETGKSLAGNGNSSSGIGMRFPLRQVFACLLMLAASLDSRAGEKKRAEALWVLKPVVAPEIPAG